MNVEHLVAQLARIQRIVQEWPLNGASVLERDLVLEQLRRIYETIRFALPADAFPSVSGLETAGETEVPDGAGTDSVPQSVHPTVTAGPQTVTEPALSAVEPAASEPVAALQEVVSEAPEPVPEAATTDGESPCEEVPAIDPQPDEGFSSAAGPQPVPVANIPAEVHPADVSAQDTAVAEPAAPQSGENLSDPAEIKRVVRARLRSLYDEETVPEQAVRAVPSESVPPASVLPADGVAVPEQGEPDTCESQGAPAVETGGQRSAEPVVFEEVEFEPEAGSVPVARPESGPAETDRSAPVLGEVVGSGGPVLGEVIGAAQTSGVPRLDAERIASLRGAIGINDKFLFIRDLFGGDAAAYERAIARLDEFDSLDEAIVWLHDHYRWNPSSEGAQLLADLLVRKLM